MWGSAGTAPSTWSWAALLLALLALLAAKTQATAGSHWVRGPETRSLPTRHHPVGQQL